MSSRNDSDGGGGSTMTTIAGIARDGVELIRLELDLARQETVEKLTPVAQNTGMVVGGGLMAIWGSTYLVRTVDRLLSTLMPEWLASLITGSALTSGGLWLINRGSTELKNTSIVPYKTINSLREDKAWLLDQIKSKLK